MFVLKNNVINIKLEKLEINEFIFFYVYNEIKLEIKNCIIIC